MIIKVPSNVRSRYDGYKGFTETFHLGTQAFHKRIVIDFQDVYFFDANLCALLGAYIEIFRKQNNSVSIINLRSSVSEIFRKNLFLNEFNENPIDDIHSTCIKYRKFHPSEENAFKAYVKNELLGKNDFPSHSMMLGQKIIENIFELYENARTHGECDIIHTCGQYFPRLESKPLKFTIVDRGINIKENVSRYLNREIGGMEAIDWAMQKGNTTKSGSIPGGLGLDIIFQFIKLNDGKIQIISSDGFWEYKKQHINKQKLAHSFEGTMANLEFNLNDKCHYYMADEQETTNFENIF